MKVTGVTCVLWHCAHGRYEDICSSNLAFPRGTSRIGGSLTWGHAGFNMHGFSSVRSSRDRVAVEVPAWHPIWSMAKDANPGRARIRQEHEGVPLGETSLSRTIRIPGMDRGQSSAALAIYHAARGQSPA